MSEEAEIRDGKDEKQRLDLRERDSRPAVRRRWYLDEDGKYRSQRMERRKQMKTPKVRIMQRNGQPAQRLRLAAHNSGQRLCWSTARKQSALRYHKSCHTLLQMPGISVVIRHPLHADLKIIRASKTSAKYLCSSLA